MARRIAKFLILVPLGILLVAFEVANRRSVVISLDPFDPAQPALSFAVPLFALMLGIAIAGVLIGGTAAWMRQRKWRRAARLAEGRSRELAAQLDRLQQREAAPPRQPGTRPPALVIPPPAA